MTDYKPFIDFSDLPVVRTASGEEINKRLKGKFKKSKRVTKFSKYGR